MNELSTLETGRISVCMRNQRINFVGSSTNYVKIERIGEGTFGTVFRGRDLTTNGVVAIKEVKMALNETKNGGFPIESLREVSLLRELDHPNVVKLKEVVMCRKQKIYLIFEYVPSSLRTFIRSWKPEGRCRFLFCDYVSGDRNPMLRTFYQIVQAILYCHCRRIIHRDLKPDNILVDKNGVVKVADFGMGRQFEIPANAYTTKVGSLWYRAPEILLGSKSYSCAVDIWSLACIFAEMRNGDPFLVGDGELGQLMKIFEAVGTPTEATWPGIELMPKFPVRWPPRKRTLHKLIKPLKLNRSSRKLFEGMMVANPKHRMDARAILSHETFESVDKTSLPAKEPP